MVQVLRRFVRWVQLEKWVLRYVGCCKFSRRGSVQLTTGESRCKLIDLRSSTLGRRATDAVGVAIDFPSSPFLAASFMAACNFRYGRSLGRWINIMSSVTRRLHAEEEPRGQWDRPRPGTRLALPASQLVMSSRLIVSPRCSPSISVWTVRDRERERERNRVHVVFSPGASIKTSFCFHSAAKLDAAPEFNYSLVLLLLGWKSWSGLWKCGV